MSNWWIIGDIIFFCLPVTCLDEKTNVRIHEGNLHRDVFTIRQDSSPICTATLDEAEDVIPSNISEISYLFLKGHLETAHRPQFRPDECCLSSKRISSIWNAAGRVSMRTVPRMVPVGIPMYDCEKLNISFHRRASR